MPTRPAKCARRHRFMANDEGRRTRTPENGGIITKTNIRTKANERQSKADAINMAESEFWAMGLPSKMLQFSRKVRGTCPALKKQKRRRWANKCRGKLHAKGNRRERGLFISGPHENRDYIYYKSARPQPYTHFTRKKDKQNTGAIPRD